MRTIDDLAGEIEVQRGATVSRVLEREGPLRLVMFAFDQGEELTEHTAAVPVVIQAISGRVTVEASGRRHTLGPNGWILLEANEPHTVVAEEPAKMLLTMVRAG